MTNCQYFSHFPQKVRFDISYNFSPQETFCMKCQTLFSGEKCFKMSSEIFPIMQSKKRHLFLFQPRIDNFLWSQKKKCYGYLLDVAHWGNSNEYLLSDVCTIGDQEVVGLIPKGSSKILSCDWSLNIFYGHSLPSTDSRRAVVSFWQKNVHKYWLTT